ncbi:MAG TPA: hypothetical protein DCX09_02495, partial [Gammaproteobacteria bacterium]|nr:hypothetical protein [Gammaproteobacteria bacterium]
QPNGGLTGQCFGLSQTQVGIANDKGFIHDTGNPDPAQKPLAMIAQYIVPMVPQLFSEYAFGTKPLL